MIDERDAIYVASGFHVPALVRMNAYAPGWGR